MTSDFGLVTGAHREWSVECDGEPSHQAHADHEAGDLEETVGRPTELGREDLDEDDVDESSRGESVDPEGDDGADQLAAPHPQRHADSDPDRDHGAERGGDLDEGREGRPLPGHAEADGDHDEHLVGEDADGEAEQVRGGVLQAESHALQQRVYPHRRHQQRAPHTRVGLTEA